MVEEAAGTRMYEVKRQNALKTMEKKDAKLQELKSVWIYLIYYRSDVFNFLLLDSS